MNAALALRSSKSLKQQLLSTEKIKLLLLTIPRQEIQTDTSGELHIKQVPAIHLFLFAMMDIANGPLLGYAN